MNLDSDMVASEYEAGSKYVLTRDESERIRLGLQHGYLKKVVYEGRLIYDESIEIEPGSQILDCGTGSGAWIMDLAREVPESVALHAIDVSSNNFPKTHPPNVQFHIASVTKLPADWTGKFDFVNQRLLMAALLASEWPVALSEMFRVLKPEGHIQLAEMELSSYFVGGKASKRIGTAVERLFEVRGMMFDCALQIPRMLKEVGYVDIASEKKYTPAGKAWGKIGELGIVSFAGALRNVGPAFVAEGIFNSEKEHHDALERLENEWEETDGVQYFYRIVCARKPTGRSQSCWIF